MKILLTGSNGFIGRALRAKLLSDSHNVVSAVRKSGDQSTRDEIAVGDIGAGTDWHQVLQGCEAIVHCAARVHMMSDDAVNKLEAFRQINVEGTLNLARQAIAAGVRRFIFLSTIKVNGELSPPDRPFRPDDTPAPIDAYGISKLEAELKLQKICVDSGMEFVMIRPALVYGPGVVGNFQALLKWIQRGIFLPFGAINNRRSFVALDNLIDLIAVCLTHPSAANQIFLAADEEDVSTTELLLKIAKAYGRGGHLLPVPVSWLWVCAAALGKKGVADRLLGSLVVDSSKAFELLGWHPVVSMDEQLRKMADGDTRS